MGSVNLKYKTTSYCTGKKKMSLFEERQRTATQDKEATAKQQNLRPVYRTNRRMFFTE